MSLLQLNATVTTSPAVVLTATAGLQYSTVTLYNGSAGDIFIGGPSVSTTGADRGLKMATATSTVIALNAGDKIYAVAGSTTDTGDLTILYSGI